MAEEMAYDHVNHYAYVAGEAGYVNVVDYKDPSNPKNTHYKFTITDDPQLTPPDIETIITCSDRGLVLFICQALDQIHIYFSRSNKLIQSEFFRIKPKIINWFYFL